MLTRPNFTVDAEGQERYERALDYDARWLRSWMEGPVKNPSFCLVLATATLLLMEAPLDAHHGAASFDTAKELKLQGTVTEWIWANPHCFLKFDAKDDTGTVRNWVVESQQPDRHVSRGWARLSFKVGDDVTVTLQPVKSGAPVGRIRSVVLPNGQRLGSQAPAPRSRARLLRSSGKDSYMKRPDPSMIACVGVRFLLLSPAVRAQLWNSPGMIAEPEQPPQTGPGPSPRPDRNLGRGRRGHRRRADTRRLR